MEKRRHCRHGSGGVLKEGTHVVLPSEEQWHFEIVLLELWSSLFLCHLILHTHNGGGICIGTMRRCCLSTRRIISKEVEALSTFQGTTRRSESNKEKVKK